MNHAQTVFLAHSLSFCAILQTYCEYYVWKRKKVRRRVNAKRTAEKFISTSLYHS